MQICFMNDDVPDDDDEDELENSASNDQDDEELGKIKVSHLFLYLFDSIQIAIASIAF